MKLNACKRKRFLLYIYITLITVCMHRNGASAFRLSKTSPALDWAVADLLSALAIAEANLSGQFAPAQHRCSLWSPSLAALLPDPCVRRHSITSSRPTRLMTGSSTGLGRGDIP